MNQRKPNKKAWYSLALAMLLCIGLLTIATGVTFARYKAERTTDFSIKVRKPELICLGTVSTETDESDPPVTTETFTPAAQLNWETRDGVTQLKFAIGNGASGEEYSARDQQVSLRMIGSLGLGTEPPGLVLTLPPEEEGKEGKVIEATVTRLVEGTALQLSYGDGWLYTFTDGAGEELFWELEGGDLNYVCLTITVTGAVPADLSLLQPYVAAEVIKD